MAHQPLYLWRPLKARLETAKDREEISEEVYDRVVNQNLGISRTDKDGRLIIEDEVIPYFVEVLNENRTRGTPKVIDEDVINYLIHHERIHQLVKKDPKLKKQITALLKKLKNSALYKDLLIKDFAELKEFFINNYGEEYRDDNKFIEELVVVYFTEKSVLNQPARLVPDKNNPKARISLPEKINKQIEKTISAELLASRGRAAARYKKVMGLLRDATGLKKEMLQAVFDNTPDEIKYNPLVDISQKEGDTIVFTRENLEDFDEVEHPKGMNLRSWYNKYKKEGSICTAGIRGIGNILFPSDPRELIGEKAIILATVGKALVAKEIQKKKYPERELHKLASCEVRYNSKEYVDLIARIQAALGIHTHLPVNKETMPIWLASFLLLKYDLLGGEYVTSSHAISKKIATKDLNDQGSQYIPDESKLFVDKIGGIIETIEKEGRYAVKRAPADNPLIDEEFMRRINNGIDDYVEYLKQGIATDQSLALINRIKKKIYIDVLGGSMYTTMHKIFEKLGILSNFKWLHIEEDPYFHGIGKSCYRLKEGKLSFEDITCDTSIVTIHSRENVKKIMPIASQAKNEIAKKDIGMQILIPVPGSSSKIYGQIRAKNDPDLKLLDKKNVEYVELNDEKVLVLEIEKRILPVIRTMGYKEKLKGVPVGTVIELTDADGDRLITAEITSMKNRRLLEDLGIAYEILDKERVLALFIPNQSFLMTLDFRKKMLEDTGDWDTRNWFIIKTTASAASWDDWAAAQEDKSYEIKYAGTDEFVKVKGVPVVNTPVGFKEIASIMKKIEKQMREAPDKPVIIKDVLGNEINLGVQPRLLYAGEESGGEIFGPTELIESVNGRKAIAVREKSAGEAMIITSAMASYLEENNISLAQYLKDIFEKNNIINRYDFRQDIIYFNESEPNPDIRKKAEQEGLKMKEESDFFYLAIAIAAREGKITFEEAKAFLQKTFPKVDFKELQAIYFVGDGVYLKFSDRVLEIRPSGTEAKTKGYALGKEPLVLISNARAMAGYYEEDMIESLKSLLNERTHEEYFKTAKFMGSEMPGIKVRALEIYNDYLAEGAETKAFIPPADYGYLIEEPQNRFQKAAERYEKAAIFNEQLGKMEEAAKNWILAASAYLAINQPLTADNYNKRAAILREELGKTTLHSVLERFKKYSGLPVATEGIKEPQTKDRTPYEIWSEVFSSLTFDKDVYRRVEKVVEDKEGNPLLGDERVTGKLNFESVEEDTDIEQFKTYGKNDYPGIIRAGEKMQQVLMNPEAEATPEAYLMYRGTFRSKADIQKAFYDNKIRYDITVVPPAQWGKEIPKTYGHYHVPVEIPEIYQVLSGEAIYLMQKENGEGDVEDAIVVRAKPGDIVIMLPGYGHLFMNASQTEPLVTANWLTWNQRSFYGSFERNRGAVAYITRDESGNIVMMPNTNYDKVVVPRQMSPADSIPAFGLVRGQPVYDLVISEKFGEFMKFLTQPDDYLNELTPEKTLQPAGKGEVIPAIGFDTLKRVLRTEATTSKSEISLEETEKGSKREFLGVVEGKVVEKYTIQMGDTLPLGKLAFGRHGELFVKKGEVDLVNTTEDIKIATIEEDWAIETRPLQEYAIYGNAESTVYFVYAPHEKESMIIAGFEAMSSPVTQQAFAEIREDKRKPIVIHEPQTLHANGSFARSRALIREESDGTVSLQQYGRTIDRLEEIELNPYCEHVFLIYTDDLQRLKEDKHLAGNLQDVITHKIIPVQRPEISNESEGVPNAVEIEIAAAILGLTKTEELKGELSGSAVTLQRVMSRLIGEEVKADSLIALMGSTLSQLADRLEILLTRMVPLPIDRMTRKFQIRRERLHRSL
ncbi:MAG: hypothetical protein JSV93_05880 [Candidatus Omnitrophota bacterium]|nr:MAG: hypothetical protein JSV93_05880 [Candidatus Omnitrophota bacterium]